jgi:hypothetical protein
MRPIFQGFCINRFGIGPLHYISSRSDLGFEFVEIFIIEKRLADLASLGVADSLTRQVAESLTHRVRESPTPRLAESAIECFKENSPLR